MGMDLNDVQMNYLLSTGAKMLGLTLLMMAAHTGGPSVLQDGGKIGMDLEKVSSPRWFPFPAMN